jgi:hypothetical protein
LQQQRQFGQRTSPDAGIQIDGNPEQRWNAPLSIRFTLNPDSNITDERDEQPAKHFLPRIATEAGTQIDHNVSQKCNSSRSIRFKRDRDSNVTDESE